MSLTYFKRQIWHGIRQRCSEGYCELRMTREEWIAFCDRNKGTINSLYASDKTPSIHRINPDGHYEVSNLQIKERWDNVRESRRRPPRPVIVIKGDTQKTFPSIKSAAKFIGGHSSNVVLACKERSRTCCGWSCQYI